MRILDGLGKVAFATGYMVGGIKGMLGIRTIPKKPLGPGDYLYDMWGERDEHGNVILTPSTTPPNPEQQPPVGEK